MFIYWYYSWVPKRCWKLNISIYFSYLFQCLCGPVPVRIKCILGFFFKYLIHCLKWQIVKCKQGLHNCKKWTCSKHFSLILQNDQIWLWLFSQVLYYLLTLLQFIISKVQCFLKGFSLNPKVFQCFKNHTTVYKWEFCYIFHGVLFHLKIPKFTYSLHYCSLMKNI